MHAPCHCKERTAPSSEVMWEVDPVPNWPKVEAKPDEE